MRLPLTKELLSKLLLEGYGVLESDRELPDENAVFTPKFVEDWKDYLHGLDEDHIRELIIEEAMKWPDEDIDGFVELPG